VYPQYEISESHGKGPVDWVIKIRNIIITITEAKKEDINQGIAQNAIQLQTSIQRNPKKRSYDTACLHEDVMEGGSVIKFVVTLSITNQQGYIDP
ncbi:3161_t:CDS:2, partial [Racocetra fulgida]